MIPCEWISEADERIGPHITNTPLTYDPELDLYLKWENHQVTGSFKVRGAFNKVLSLQAWERERGFVAASAGNHGLGVALAAQMVKSRATIFVSENAVPSKVAAMHELGADVHLIPGGYGEAETAGLEYAASTGANWISPYNDGQIIAGQATLGKELLRDLSDPGNTTWIVPVGGGGLMAGLACSVHCDKPSSQQTQHNSTGLPKLIAVQSEASPFLHAVYHRGSQDGVVELPSLADGLAGKIDQNSITIPILRRYLDDFILVSESEIKKAITFVWEQYRERIEGSAAAAIAVVLENKIRARPAVAIITGGNIQPEVHTTLCQESGVK